MNPGHRLDLGSNITFIEDIPCKDAIVMSTYSRDPLGKANSGDEDEDTQLSCPLPGSKIYKDSRVDRYTGPLAESLAQT